MSEKTIPTPKPKPKTSAAISAALKLKTTEAARRRKVEEDIDNEQSDTSVLSDENYQQQRTLINMNEVFMLNAEKLLTDGPATIQVFHDQANLPNFKTHWKQIITENALVPIRFRLNEMKAVLGYTQPECSTWPVIRGVTLSIRQIAKDLTACFSQATRTSNTTYDYNEKIRAYKFAYDFADAYVEEASITRFEEIISLYYPDRTDLTPERENEICKAFYKKLPAENALGMKSLETTKTSIKKTKRDTIQDMYMRLSDHLNIARQCVNNAVELGNSRYRWTTPDSPTTAV